MQPLLLVKTLKIGPVRVAIVAFVNNFPPCARWPLCGVSVRIEFLAHSINVMKLSENLLQMSALFRGLRIICIYVVINRPLSYSLNGNV